jgi:hypothetical protein
MHEGHHCNGYKLKNRFTIHIVVYGYKVFTSIFRNEPICVFS